MQASDETVVRFDRVTKTYGAITALDGVNAEIRAGSAVGLVGSNGAGKSTLLNLMVGIRRPDSGEVVVYGGSPREPAHRERVGMTPQDTGLPASVRVRELLDVAARHYRSPDSIDRVQERFGLGDLAHRQAGGLSGGQQRRVALALAFVGRPDLVILDEPTTGLDVESRELLWENIRGHVAEGGTLVVSSHYLEEIEALADRILVLKDGRVVADDEPAAIKKTADLHTVRFRSPTLPPLTGVAEIESDGDRHLVRTRSPEHLLKQLLDRDVPCTDLEVTRPSLAEAFRALDSTTGTSVRPAEEDPS